MLLLTADPVDGALNGAAACLEHGTLIVTAQGHVECYSTAAVAAAAAAGAQPAAPHRLWKHRVVGGRVEHAVPLTPNGSAYLLVTSHGAAAPPHAAVVTLASPGGDGSGPNQAVAAQVVLVSEERLNDPLTAPVFSNLAPSSSGVGGLLAASLQQGSVHLIQAQRGAGGTWQLTAAATGLCDLVTTEPGATIAVESLALGPSSAHLAAPGAPRLHAAILYSSHSLGGGLCVKHVACLEVEGQQLRSCAWFHRNVHPSTSLVAALPGALMLVAASHCLALVHADTPQDRQLVRVRLQGRPTCVAALSEHLAVVGDAAGQLTLVDLRRLEGVPVARGMLAAAPSHLAFLPASAAASIATTGSAVKDPTAAAAAAGAPEGLLFVGSTAGGSLFLEVPRWQVAPAGDACQLSASVAPVASAVMFDDDCGDRRLLACSGRTPFGRLAMGRLAAGLAPLAAGGGDLPGLVRLLGLKASPAAASHRYLLLSCDAAATGAGAGGSAGWTLVLEAEAGELRSAELPGMQLEAATLLASPLVGGGMLQVTPQAASVFRPTASGAVQSSWSPPAGSQVSLAAQHGQYVALACGAHLQVLYCGGSGRLQEECQLDLPQQASALALFELGAGGGGAGDESGEVWLAAGLWLTNQVLLQPLSAREPACRLALDCQPRSLAVVRASGGVSYLVVGSSSGELLWWRVEVQRDEFGASSGVRLHECGWARAGVAPVSLHLLPPAAFGSGPPSGSSGAEGSCGSSRSAAGGEAGAAAAAAGSRPLLLAVSDQALLLGSDPLNPSRLAATRLHGGQGLTAACPMVTSELPGSEVAYVQGGELHIGGLDPAVQLRWDDVVLPTGTNASSASYMSDSGIAAVACTEADGSSGLRLLELPALQQLAHLPMPEGHNITALAAVHLPCSSLWEQAPLAGQSTSSGGAGGSGHGSSAAEAATAVGATQQAPASKQFLLVALSADSWAAGSNSTPALTDELPGPAADSRQPWWRQRAALEPGRSQEQQSEQAAGATPQQQQAGLLRVYELRRRQEGAAATVAGSSEGSSSCGGGAHDLVLHGSCTLPSAIFSLTTVQPDGEPFDVKGAQALAGMPAGVSSPAGAGVPAAAPAQQQQLLAAGCHDGAVRLYRVFVDDAGLEGRHALEEGLASIGAAPRDPLGFASEQQEQEQEAQERVQQLSARAAQMAQHQAGPPLADERRLWHQHVAMQLVAKGPTCFEGIPTSLAACGSSLYALDLLSSLTAFRVQALAAGQLPSLVPLAADLAGQHLSAMLPLSGTAVLAGLHSGGLLLIKRDLAAERERQAAGRSRWEAQQELGGGGGGEEAGAGQPAPRPAGTARRYVPTLHESVQLDVAASHADLPGSVAAICPGLLGVPRRQLGELLGSGGSRSGSGSSSSGSSSGGAATVVCTSGAIVSARLLTPEQHGVLWQLQRAAELTAGAEAGRDSQLSLAPAGGTARAAASVVTAPGGCLDGSLLAAAYVHPAWHQRLLRVAPCEMVREGRDILTAHGLL